MVINKFYVLSKRLQNYEIVSICQRTNGLKMTNRRDFLANILLPWLIRVFFAAMM